MSVKRNGGTNGIAGRNRLVLDHRAVPAHREANHLAQELLIDLPQNSAGKTENS